jgi:hypothetical protein
LQRMIRQLDMPLSTEVHEVNYVRNGFWVFGKVLGFYYYWGF